MTDNQRDNRKLTEFYRPEWRWWEVWRWPWKYRLAVCAAVAAVVWLDQTGAGSRHSPGLLASVHATWDTQCNACHGTLSSGEQGGWWRAKLAFDRVQSDRCRECHAGPPHHQVSEKFEAECSACHREHRGRDASLLRVADERCTSCHSNLHEHKSGDGILPPIADRVERFTSDHPHFRSVASDPGQLEFNHARHMTDGMPLTTGGKPRTLAEIPQPWRERFRQKGQEDTAPVHLECTSCHQLDRQDGPDRAARLPADFRTPRSDGRYFLPIVYEAHCQGCHPLTFDRDLPEREVPHRLQPDEVRRALEEVYLTEYLQGNAKLLRRPLPRQLPNAGMAKAGEYVWEAVQKAEMLLYLGQTGCAECHHFDNPHNTVKPEGIIPTAIPAIWLRHAVFDHKAHRAIDCRECHASAWGAKKSSEVLIPDRDKCLNCHRAATSPLDLQAGPARSNCTECHWYHDGDHVLAGVGSVARQPENKRSVEGFLPPR
jgi:hypothetical protein